MSSTLLFIHLIGLALGVGAATVKTALLLRSANGDDLLSAYLKIVRPVTGLLITGLILLTASGIGWLLLGYPWTGQLIVKCVLVGAVWVLGPLIDNVFEPKFRQLAPVPGAAASAEFLRARKRYLAMELAATGLFYVIIAYWVLI